MSTVLVALPVLFCLVVVVTGIPVLIHMRRGHGPGCRICRLLNRVS